MGLPKVPYFAETNPVITAQSSARTVLSACRLATGTAHDTVPGFPAGVLQAGYTEKVLAAGCETPVVNGCVNLGGVMCLVYVCGVCGWGDGKWVYPGPLLRSLQVPRCIGARGTLRLWHLQTPDPLFLGR